MKQSIVVSRYRCFRNNIVIFHLVGDAVAWLLVLLRRHSRRCTHHYLLSFISSWPWSLNTTCATNLLDAAAVVVVSFFFSDDDEK